MNKLVIALLFIIAGISLAQFVQPDAGLTPTQDVPSVTFTNGWAISCTSTSLVFVAP
jgi:hypothetical protein